MGPPEGSAQNRPPKHLTRRRQSFRSKTGRAGRGRGVGRGSGSVEGPSLHQQTFLETCCVQEPQWLSELTFKQALPKKNQMEVCKQLIGWSPGVYGGKGNNVGEKFGFRGGLARWL